jgi:hypothetical protein
VTQTPATSDRLADKQPVTVIVRLLIDASGQLVHGEVADLAGRVRGRFRRWDRLAQAVQACVTAWRLSIAARKDPE